MMVKHRTLLYFGAHPDDETFGMGATLALYVLRGVKVYCVCSTGGEAGTVDPKFIEGYASIVDLRWHELKCAAQVLGLADVMGLGYRDSDMPGSKQNRHPDALAMAPIEEVAEKMTKIIRELKPDVVLTHDAGGGYGHPDHIATHNATVKAFYAAGDRAQYHNAGPVFQPQKLYFGIRPRRYTKLIVKLMPLLGQDPHHFGRNKDIDITKTMAVDYPIHARISPTKQARAIRVKAAACHASQGGGQSRTGPFLFRMYAMLQRRRDYFMREYPPPTGRLEKDLFEELPE